jgi:hypothetical protein
MLNYLRLLTASCSDALHNCYLHLRSTNKLSHFSLIVISSHDTYANNAGEHNTPYK